MGSNPMSLSRSVIRLVRQCQKDALRSTAVFIGKNLPRLVHEWQVRRRMLQHQRFDLKYQLNTQIPVPVAELETTAPGAKFAHRYQGTPIAVLRRIIRRLKLDRQRFTFIDLGSGKGRVLLIAAQY